MIIEMDKLFKVHIVKKSDDPSKLKPLDPYELYQWSKMFGVNPSDMLISFCFYLMRVLKLRVQHSVETQTINGQSMKKLYTHLSLKYKKINPKKTGRFWEDTEFLIGSIKVWQTSTRRVMFGIPRNIYHPTSRVPAYKLFHYLEFGTRRNGKQIIPPRPLIYPHLKFILDNIQSYWLMFINLLKSRKITLPKKGTGLL